jgi:hypothetical protein
MQTQKFSLHKPIMWHDGMLGHFLNENTYKIQPDLSIQHKNENLQDTLHSQY